MKQAEREEVSTLSLVLGPSHLKHTRSRLTAADILDSGLWRQWLWPEVAGVRPIQPEFYPKQGPGADWSMRRTNTEETGRRKSPTVKNEEDQKCREYGGGYQGSLEKRAENINAGCTEAKRGKRSIHRIQTVGHSNLSKNTFSGFPGRTRD